VNNKKYGVQKSAGVATSYNSSPDQHQGQQKEMLLYNISCGIYFLLNKSEENSLKKEDHLRRGTGRLHNCTNGCFISVGTSKRAGRKQQIQPTRQNAKSHVKTYY
jgi:hypothetical protein